MWLAPAVFHQDLPSGAHVRLPCLQLHIWPPNPHVEDNYNITTTHNLEKQRQGSCESLHQKKEVFRIMRWFFKCKSCRQQKQMCKKYWQLEIRSLFQKVLFVKFQKSQKIFPDFIVSSHWMVTPLIIGAHLGHRFLHLVKASERGPLWK